MKVSGQLQVTDVLLPERKFISRSAEKCTHDETLHGSTGI